MMNNESNSIGISYCDLGKYIRVFDETPEGRKTKIYDLVNSQNEFIHLGQIKWFANWRKYCFYPEEETIFDNKCLLDIINFLDKVNKCHKEGKEF